MQDALSHYIGRNVEAINFRGITGTDVQMLRGMISVEPGKPLDADQLHASLKTLYSTGRFSNLQVEADQDQQNGIVLTFVATENYFNGNVQVDGLSRNKSPRPNELVNATRLDLGSVFSEEKVSRGVESMQKVMRDNGFYRAKITCDLKPNEQTRQMAVDFHVVPGAVSRVGQVTIQGDSTLTPEDVTKITKLKPGAKVSSSNVARALTRLRKKYQKNSHLEAQVSLVDKHYDPGTNELSYEFKVNPGAVVAITTEGEKIRKGRLQQLIPVYQENAVDDDLLNEGKRNLNDYLQTKGYFDASVEVSREQPKPDLVNIVYKIDTGPHHKLVAIKVEGNKYFSTEIIKERLSIQTASIALSSGRFSQRLLNNDLASIKYLYEANGFLSARAEAKEIDNYEGATGRMAVLIKIDEGAQTRVGLLTITGDKTFPADELLNRVSNREGQPYSVANVINDRDALTYFYYNRGFPDVQFEYETRPDKENPERMNVTYSIKEGEQVFVQQVLISGLGFTKPFIVNREMRVSAGDPLSQVEMVDSQRRLYDLGIFNQVNTAIQNPDGIEPQKNVLFNLAEAQRWTFRYGGGIEVATGNIPGNTPQGKTGVSPNGVLEITRLNMFGRDQTLTMRGRLGLLTRRALISYDAPRLFRKEDWRVSVSGFYDNTADVNTFTSERLEGSVQAEQRYSRSTTMLYRLSYQRVRVDPDSLVIDPRLIPLYSQPVRIAMPSFTWIHDKRDNPIDTHKGSYSFADLGIATTALGSQADFGRVLVQNSTYYPFKKGWVLARSTQIGVEYPYGVTTYPGGEPSGGQPLPAENTVIPLPELFFSGGGNSLRGFAINQAGPRDPVSGYPIGGQGLFVNNLELRTPPVPLPYAGNNLGLVFFHDMGNVFDTANHIVSGMLRINQPSIAACSPPGSTVPCNFNYNPQAVGMGVRYKTPVGPVRFDLGYNFNPTRYPVQEENTTESLRRWNFFFSIGQTF